MNFKIYLLGALASVSLFSCVSQKQMRQAEAQYAELKGNYVDLQGKYRNLQDELNKANADKDKLAAIKAGLESQITSLNNQTDFLKQNSNTVLKQLEGLSFFLDLTHKYLVKFLQLLLRVLHLNPSYL